ncbi:MAG: RsmB/NOP family class I SAM-dependent RNA methyltransferase [Hyphomicrobium sp.]|uniref:RsmB/NOP family class I SAM-dependent RNA methyltransferase n=2 Tax=Hyphomicrobium sp. TaxID=82 RepID=UPI0025BA6BE1|nr:RsmB/NOP family class I SAM-dependent RNA methyltransferase [Hyphomicrobium sp.]MBZ0209068.1 RsmB/NOP family class I SAM-dependent RNA methyltransferase [Hyphomicrobium sp.]
MRAGARIAAATEVLEDILARHRPAATALADWGKAHRFAGSGDRAAIGTLVFDALRRRASLAARMGADTPRALALGAAPGALGLTPEQVAAAADGLLHAPAPLSETEKSGLSAALPQGVPAHIAGDIPAWLLPSFERAFGAGAAEEGAALAARAPIDLRVNTLKGTREKVVKALERYGAAPTPLAPTGVRVPAPEGARKALHLEAEAAHGKGWFEVQDEGSQLAALLAGAAPRMQVLDLCAGAGGKTLALAATMQNTGQIYAYDADRKQLRPIFERLKRAGVRNVQVLEAGNEEALAALGPRFDLVLVDAPCTGSGTWRRKPDAKWRVRPANIPERQAEQARVLDLGASLTKPGGALAYVTCSVLPEENRDQVEAFLGRHGEFAVEPFTTAWAERIGAVPPRSADGRDDTLQLTPARHGTDGFFIALMRRHRP